MNTENERFLNDFLNYLKVEKRYSENTIIAYRNDILNYIYFLESEDFGTISEASNQIAEWYLASLSDKYTPKSIQRKISSLKNMYNYFINKRELEVSPFFDITLPKVEKRLPKFIYENEVEEFFNSIDTSTEIGKRDRLIFSLLYGSGLRVSELTSLRLKDVNVDEKIINVHGKGSKDRIVPMSNETQELFMNYLILSRPHLLKKSNNLDNDIIFLNFKGTSLTSRGVRDILNRLIESSSSTLRISPHTFRHSFATHLLNSGMDVRMVQELLGHSNLSTTQIYTKISKESLMKEYEKAFPKGDNKK